MMQRTCLGLLALLVMGLPGCEDGAKGKTGVSCSVRAEADGAVTVSCDDGTENTLRPPKPEDRDAGSPEVCSVSQTATLVTIRCPDGSVVTLPIAPALDGGATVDAAPSGSCTVSQDALGTITIRCPDGSETVIPGPGEPATRPRLVGAAAASCGTCHDTSGAKAHFQAMTVDSDAGPIETCGTCHRETSIEPVSKVHARLPEGTPDFHVEILDANIDTLTRKPVVRLRFTEGQAAPIAREGLSVSFVVAKVTSVTDAIGEHTIPGAYENYLLRTATQLDTESYPLNGGAPRVVQQPTAENSTTGVFTAVEPGVYDYTFKFALPEGYDAAAPHQVALYATRTLNGERLVANASRFFVPNNPAAPTQVRDSVRTETCNNCHNPLSAHGGARQDVQLCLGCHTQGAVDPESGNSLDFNVMVHRIHSGRDLLSVKAGKPYSIIGYGASVVDFSKVGFPQPVENCQSCHTQTDGERWVENGVRTACTSCHENVDNAEGPGAHPFPLNLDADCGNANCHGPGGNVADGREAHLTVLNDPSTPLFELTLLEVQVADLDGPVRVRIDARTGTRATGALLPVTQVDKLSSLNVFINGPNQGYLLSGQELVQVQKTDLVGLTANVDKPGELSFELPSSLRETLGRVGDPGRDSYTLSVGAVYDPTPGALPDTDRVVAREQPVLPFSVAEELTERRAVVETSRCNTCHGELHAHGGDSLARNVEQCVMCHTGGLDTRVRQGANKVAGPTTSLRFSTLIHRIHAREIATLPYTVYGFSPQPPYPALDFSSLPFPGDVRDCGTCHRDGTYFLPLPEGDPPTVTSVLDADGHVVP